LDSEESVLNNVAHFRIYGNGPSGNLKSTGIW